MTLPIELFDNIIHNLRHDRQALSALALTHRALTPGAQQRIFYHITISGEQDDTDNTDSILLALVNSKHAHLLKYIHSLTLINSLYRPVRSNSTNSVYTPNPLIPGFIDAIAPQLSSLVLNGFAPGWDHDDAVPLRASITRLLASPALTHLELHRVHNFSLPLLHRASSLTSLRFATPYPSYAPLNDDNIPPDAEPIYLDTLEIDLWGEVPPRRFINWILGDSSSPRLSVARLRRISINGSYTREVARSFWRLLEACHSTLQHLTIGPDTFSHNNSNTLNCATALRTLELKIGLSYIERALHLNTTPFQFLIYILTNLPTPSPLEELDIQIQYDAPSYRELDMSHWDTLASFLSEKVSNGKFPRLTRIGVGVLAAPAGFDTVNPQDVFPTIKARFADFFNATSIKFELQDSVIELDVLNNEF